MKFLSALFFLAIGALAGCGNDSDPRPPADVAAGSGSTTAPVLTSEAKLTSSEPVSIEGGASLIKSCNVEGVDGALFAAEALTIPRKGTHEISGWVVDADNRSVPQDLKLILAGVGVTGGTWTNQTPVWVERKGVAETRGYGPELNNSGFSFTVDTSVVPAGTYHVYVISSGTKGLVVCDPGRQLTLTP